MAELVKLPAGVTPEQYPGPVVADDTRTFGPLAALVPEGTTPELAYLEAKSGLAADFARWCPGFTQTSEATLDDQPVAA